MAVLIFTLGIVSMALAVAGNLWIGKRQFNRRNSAGVQEYQDYGGYMKTRFIEGFTRAGVTLFGVIGVFDIVIGLFQIF